MQTPNIPASNSEFFLIQSPHSRFNPPLTCDIGYFLNRKSKYYTPLDRKLSGLETNIHPDQYITDLARVTNATKFI